MALITTNVMPTATIPIGAARLNTSVMLSTLANPSMKMAAKISNNAVKTKTPCWDIQTRRLKSCCSTPTSRSDTSGVWLGSMVFSTVMRRPCRFAGGEGHHRLLVGVDARQRADDAAVADDVDHVGQLEQFGEIGTHHEHGCAVVGQLPDQAVDLDLGADIDPTRRLVEDDHVGLTAEPLGQHDLLLVAAAEVARIAPDVRWPEAGFVGEMLRELGDLAEHQHAVA